ncbi:FAD-dependent oxidoreductase [Mycolicibacterium setense]
MSYNTHPDGASSSSAVRPRVAVVGSGPSGCFTAQALRKRSPDIELVVFDSLPTPYGLIRHGIAPDHQGAKTIQRQFDRLFGQPGIRFVGNTTIGTDLPGPVLLTLFHAVIFATGLPDDRPLDVRLGPGTEVLGAGALLRLLNSDPDVELRHRPDGMPALGESIAIVGTGNVAIDIARLLAKSAAELEDSDIDDIARSAVVGQPVETIHIIGRCVPGQAKWDASMFKELAEVAAVKLHVDGVPIGSASTSEPVGTLVDVRFRQTLHAVQRDGDKTRVTTYEGGDPFRPRHITVDTVISAVGFEKAAGTAPLAGIAHAPNVFHAGNRRTGRLGNLAENRKLAAATAQEVADYLAGHAGMLPALPHLDEHLPHRHVTFDDWLRIDLAESTRARPGRCRTKFTSRTELLTAAHAPLETSQ